MRLRGFVFFLMGTPLAIYMSHSTHVKSSEFYEYGSIAMPAPLWARGSALLSLLLMVAGLWLVPLDFIRWIRRRRNERTN
jgi:hypothetical protein